MTSVLIRDKERRDRVRSGAGLVNVEAETGVLWPQGQELEELEEARSLQLAHGSANTRL